MCKKPELFHSLKSNNNQFSVPVGNGISVKVSGVVNVLFVSIIDAQKRTVEVQDVLFVPKLV